MKRAGDLFRHVYGWELHPTIICHPYAGGGETKPLEATAADGSKSFVEAPVHADDQLGHVHA